MPETHLDWHARSRPLVLDAKKGDAIIFDWRLKHRGAYRRRNSAGGAPPFSLCGSSVPLERRVLGLANRSNEPRPMIYLTYALPWFVDRYNFSTDRYDDLPPMVPRSSRAERTSRRDESAAANAPLSAAADDSDDEEDDEEDDDNDDDGSDDDNENDGSDDGSDDENDDDADAEE
ncbi:hypothetical protein M885DRAFT_330376 [Pelagophyceae sp. CCMP2097]|nr:hypothetical protein M885DRAFT_330376 [Pelagophyceae sp. CCMP2097]